MSVAANKAVCDGLSKLLANTYILYLKTQNFHWNVTGPYFYALHGLFETQYQELALAVDEIAERIRALGEIAPASFSQYGKLASIRECVQLPSAQEMLRQLIDDQVTLIELVKEFMPHVEEARDQSTVDLLTRRLLVHEKNAWMLRSSIG